MLRLLILGVMIMCCWVRLVIYMYAKVMIICCVRC